MNRFSRFGGGLLLASLAACGPDPAASRPTPPPPEVKVAEVLVRDVPVQVEALGELRGNNEIEIRARVEGYVQSVDYREGSLVAKGDLLYTIDPRPLEARLAAARAGLAEAEAGLARAHQDVARYEPLVARNAVSRQEYETAVALERAAAASVEAARAAVTQAELDLSFTRVTAPEAGLVGRTEVFAGSLVGRGGSTLLTRLSRTDPIHARFSFPERDYLEFARKKGTGVGDGKDGPAFELLLADGSVHPHAGALVFVDRAIDTRTGTILLEASFPNPGTILRPGQYARVRATVETRAGAILVPQRAVREMQGLFHVMVVGAGDSVAQRMVVPGERLGTLWVIASGLVAGERIVVEGLQKVRDGLRVVPELVEAEAPVAGAR